MSLNTSSVFKLTILSNSSSACGGKRILMKKYKMQEEIGSEKTPVLSLGLDASADSAECVKGVKLQVTDL